MVTDPRGRPRDSQIDQAVLAAAGTVLDDAGYRAVAMEDVARRAGVSKTALYRRWPGRSRLVLDVLRQRMTSLVPVDTGCTLCDLDELLGATTDVFCRLGPGTVAQLLAEASTDPDLHHQLLQHLVDPVRTSVRRTLEIARRRGDLRSSADLDLSAETLCALSFHRLLFGQRPLDRSETALVVTGVLRGIARDPDQLLQQYDDRAHPGRHQTEVRSRSSR